MAAIVATSVIVLADVIISQTPAAPPLVTQSEYESWIAELSNWGRWGPGDELGALNLITPAKRAEAARLVTEGFTVSLASTAQTAQTVDNPCPVAWGMVRATRAAATDRIAYPCIHGPERLISMLSHTSSSMVECGTATTSKPS